MSPSKVRLLPVAKMAALLGTSAFSDLPRIRTLRLVCVMIWQRSSPPKRYATGSSIGVDKIREFAGALDERGATKGVFVTTSHFAPAAIQYAQRSPKRLILIDGEELTRLLVKYGVAVRSYRILELKEGRYGLLR